MPDKVWYVTGLETANVYAMDVNNFGGWVVHDVSTPFLLIQESVALHLVQHGGPKSATSYITIMHGKALCISRRQRSSLPPLAPLSCSRCPVPRRSLSIPFPAIFVP